MPRLSFRDLASRLKSSFGIRQRLVVLSLILVVPLMLDRVMVLEHTRANQTRIATEDLTKLARQTAAAQRDVMSSVEAVLHSAAYIQVAAEQTGQSCAILRASIRIEMPWIISLSVVGKNGRISCSTMPNYIGLDISDRPYYRQAIETHGFVLSDLVISRLNGHPLLLASYPTSAIAAGSPSVILVGLNMEWIGGLMTSLAERPGVEAALIDGRDLVLASQPADPDTFGKPYAGLVAEATKSAGDTGSALIATPRGKRLISWARIADTGTRMIVSIDYESLMAPIKRDIQKAYLQLAFVAILALIGAWFVGEQFIIRPIRLLTGMANRFGQGDRAARATARELPAEFKPLANAFNAMAAQLAERERELIASNDHLTVMASIDMVSGLANRRGFQARLEFEWLRMHQLQAPLALMMIDVDYFKLYNDSYGHPEGDACLARIGDALARIANETMGFAARYGGEEFCLLLPNIDRPRALEIGEALRQRIEDMLIPHLTSDFGRVTVSVGVSLAVPQSDQRPEELVEAADAALYAAKHRGRNSVVGHGLPEALPAPVSLAG
ncbi:diguanylate cyclase domain-containing protein [Bradyrhizobium sp. WD16]|uniref:sensor domain-containing diguanylate cyclase n=1 Tax=Bradyrhizobium sp. WD16 TaxID=1521768 RepID=UPI0020A250EE|nr:diguanylate cyclase [Bradyrhizobium sp. WD16]UTD27032.1 GGDEF domain-containing protein [Bradyrhizobium sp. WD16]